MSIKNPKFKNHNSQKPNHAINDLKTLFFDFLATDHADCQETRNRMLVSYAYMKQLLKEQS